QQAAESVRPFLDALPLPTGPEFLDGQNQPIGAAPLIASWSDPSTLDATSIRIDHVVNQKLTMFSRYNNAPSKNITSSSSTPNMLTMIANTAHTLTVAATLALTPHFANELRANYSSNSSFLSTKLDNFGGAIPVDSSLLFPSFASPAKGQVGVRFALGGVNFYSMGRSVDSKQRQINIVDNLSYDTGAHQLKFGVDYRRLSPIFGPNEFFRQLNFDTQNDIRTGRVTSMTT